MILILLEIAALLAVIILPLAGPQQKQKRKKKLSIDTDVSNAHYAINEHGFLVKIHGKELSKYEL